MVGRLSYTRHCWSENKYHKDLGPKCSASIFFCQTPVLGLGLGVDFSFTWDNNNNNNYNDKNNNDKNNPNLDFLKETAIGDKEQGLGIRYKG